jgi:thiamine kinase-like enzyme
VLAFAAVEADPRLEKVLEALWPGRDPVLTPITSGITNANLKVELDGEAFVVRLPGTDTELLGIDRHAELEATRTAAAAGVGPEVVDFVEGCLVTRFVEGMPIPVEELQRADILDKVVRSIRAIHDAPPIPSSFPVFQVVERYRDLAAERGVEIPSAFGTAVDLAARIQRAFERNPMPERTCHNDLLNANFLRDGDHVWIVDYEYAGMGDPFFDLGNFAVNNELDEAGGDRLLEAYFREPATPRRQAALNLFRFMSDFREAMWGVVQTSVSELDFDFPGYADKHFQRLTATGGDPRFRTWLEEAGGG